MSLGLELLLDRRRQMKQNPNKCGNCGYWFSEHPYSERFQMIYCPTDTRFKERENNVTHRIETQGTYLSIRRS
jgi:hypothetical protein